MYNKNYTFCILNNFFYYNKIDLNIIYNHIYNYKLYFTNGFYIYITIRKRKILYWKNK